MASLGGVSLSQHPLMQWDSCVLSLLPLPRGDRHTSDFICPPEMLSWCARPALASQSPNCELLLLTHFYDSSVPSEGVNDPSWPSRALTLSQALLTCSLSQQPLVVIYAHFVDEETEA